MHFLLLNNFLKDLITSRIHCLLKMSHLFHCTSLLLALGTRVINWPVLLDLREDIHPLSSSFTKRQTSYEESAPILSFSKLTFPSSLQSHECKIETNIYRILLQHIKQDSQTTKEGLQLLRYECHDVEFLIKGIKHFTWLTYASVWTWKVCVCSKLSLLFCNVDTHRTCSNIKADLCFSFCKREQWQ